MFRPRTSTLALVGLTLSFGLAAEANPAVTPVSGGSVQRVGTINHIGITEGSGLVASRRYPGVVWTHNDGGHQFVFAINESGGYLGAFQVVGANLIDWEAISADEFGNLYLADIGFDGMERTHVAVHRIREPNPAKRYGNVEAERTWYLRFPGIRQDCESFFVHDGYGYLITKPVIAGRVAMYRFALSSRGSSIPLEPVTNIPVIGDATDASISNDRQRLGLVTSSGVHMFNIGGFPANLGSAPSQFIPFSNDFTEGGTFVSGGLLVSAETRELWLFNFASGSGSGDPAPAPTLQATSTGTGAIQISFFAVAGNRYSLEACDDLAVGSWSSTGEVKEITETGTTSFTVPVADSTRFYRVKGTSIGSPE